MSDERRTTRRIRLSGVQVTYESATGERQQARVVDLSREGLFIPSATPLAVGKRLSLEIQPIGDVSAWSALGRIVWVRDVGEGAERPAGMAVKIIDAEDSVLDGIQQLLEAREPTERGLGTGDAILPVRPRARSNPPAREKTMLGVGIEGGSTPAAPILITVPGREPTLVGVGLVDGAAPEREGSLAINLVTKKPPSERPAEAPAEIAPVAPPAVAAVSPVTSPALADSLEPEEPVGSPVRRASKPERESVEPAPRRRSGGGWILFLLAAGAAGAGFVFRDRVLFYGHIAFEAIAKQLR